MAGNSKRNIELEERYLMLFDTSSATLDAFLQVCITLLSFSASLVCLKTVYSMLQPT